MKTKKWGPMDTSHIPEKPCPACGKQFKEGDYTTLIPLGPGDSEEDRARRDAGQVYNSVCALVHWDCSPFTEEEEYYGKY